MKPDFIIIGAQKSATTFVQRALSDHPEIFLPEGEIRHFENPWFLEDDQSAFTRHFQQVQEGSRVGFKRADMLSLPECTARIHEHCPDTRLIATLRHPIERAISAYFHYMRYDALPLCEVELGMRKILENRYPDYPYASRVLEYGRYAHHLDRWFQYFPRDQMLVLLHDEIFRNPQESMQRVHDFLGIGDTHRSGNLNRRSQMVVYSLPRLQFLRLRTPFVFRWSKDRMASTWRFGRFSRALWYGFEAIDRYILAWFYPNEKPVLSPCLWNDLTDFYREDVNRLPELLEGKELPWTF